MNKRFLSGIVVLSIMLCSGYSQASIKGSVHDFSSKSWNSSGEICIVCHTPHNASDGSIPLWAHKTTTATFKVYSSPTVKSTMDQPSGISLACLSCHDGTVALDSFGGKTGKEFIKGNAALGTDLSKDHPISFIYDSNLAKTTGDLMDPTTAPSGVGNTIQKDLLRNNKVECSSCHDVHNGAASDHLLVKANAGSKLCFTCHNK